MGKKVAAIVVTYNRKELLAECQSAICAQEFKPVCVYVIDNASTDGTDEWIKENGYDGEKSGIQFRYVRLSENIGGAGGFYTGLKMAHEAEDKFDAFWLMDDDGVPDKAQLKNLLAYSNKYDCLAPMVIAKEDATRCAFYECTVEDFKKKAIDGVAVNEGAPFNGLLYTRKLVDAIGYPIKDMFIWGDEVNYTLRIMKNGFIPVTVIDAIHTHPRDRQKLYKMWRKSFVVPESNWKLYVYVRNYLYNKKVFSRRSRHFVRKAYQVAREFTYYFILKVPSWHRLSIVYRAIWDAARGDLSRHKYYMQ